MTKPFTLAGLVAVFFCLVLTGCKAPRPPPVPGPIQPPPPPGTSLGR